MPTPDTGRAATKTSDDKVHPSRQSKSERRASGDGLVNQVGHDEKATSSEETGAKSGTKDGKENDSSISVGEGKEKKDSDAPPPVPFFQLFR